MHQFEKINSGFNGSFKYGKLSLGIVIPIENYAHSAIPSMKEQLERIQLVEQLNFKAAWLRDVPFHVPSFGDAGQLFDPFSYLGYLTAYTDKIALGVSSIALPLRHPIHVVKSAATIDQLSEGRLILGVASGDRPTEYPAMGIDFNLRAELFREAFHYIRTAQKGVPSFKTKHFGHSIEHMNILPKAFNHKIPMMITGFSQQSLAWNAEFGDGWMYYPQELKQQANNIKTWRQLVSQFHGFNKPFLQPLYLDLQEDPDFKPEPIHLGFKIGSNYLNDYLYQLEEIGVNHLAINLRFNSLGTVRTLNLLAEQVLPNFNF